MKYNKYAFGIMIAIVSFLGFVSENLWLACVKGRIDNRSMHAPFLLGYGLLIVLIYFVLGTPKNCRIHKLIKTELSLKRKYMLYFGVAFVVVCIGELLLGLTVESISGIQYWDYSWIPLHFTQYTSIPTSLGFATAMTFFMGKVFEPLMDLIMRMNPMAMKIVSIILMLVMCSDFIVSFYQMIKKRSHIIRWRIFLR